MDLSTLPPEMLANILKYNKFGSIQKLRKMSSYVDSTVKRYGLSKRIPIDSMKIVFFDFANNWILKIDFDRSLMAYSRRYVYTLNETPMFEKGKEWIEKVIIKKSFEIVNSLEIDEDFLLLIKNNKTAFRNVRQLRLKYAKLSLVKDKMKTFILLLPKLKYLVIDSETKLEGLVNSEVLGNRKWQNIFLNFDESQSIDCLNDQFLHEVVKNCIYFSLLSGRSFFTLLGVTDMIKEVFTNDSNEYRHFMLDIVHLEGTNFAVANNFVNTLPKVKSKRISYIDRDVHYSVTFNTDFGCKNPYLTFALTRPGNEE